MSIYDKKIFLYTNLLKISNIYVREAVVANWLRI
uniref:Uncharacterized protein n=1 Tax=Lepeophtheirus salmonis TaxID=72036 RepID=A0A0K2UDN6_LEPSM